MATWGSGELFSSAKGNVVGTVASRAERTSISPGSTSSTDAGIVRLDTIPIKANMIYLIMVFCHPDSTVSTDRARVQLRYNISGTATVSSPVLPGAQGFGPVGAPMMLMTTFSSVSDLPNMSIWAGIARNSGTGTVTAYADGSRNTVVVVVALGVDPGDTGVDL